MNSMSSIPETNACRPVGMAEMAIAVRSSSKWLTGKPRTTPTIPMNATAVHQGALASSPRGAACRQGCDDLHAAVTLRRWNSGSQP